MQGERTKLTQAYAYNVKYLNDMLYCCCCCFVLLFLFLLFCIAWSRQQPLSGHDDLLFAQSN